MKQFWTWLLCIVLGCQERVTIEHGWAVTRCLRCREILSSEVLRTT